MPHNELPRYEDPVAPESPWEVLLVVSGILTFVCVLWLVLGVGLGFYSKVRVSQVRSQNSNNLRQIGLAVHNCNDIYMEMPLVSGPWKWAAPNDTLDRSIFFCLLPYVEQDKLYKSVLSGVPGVTTTVCIKTYFDPADPTGKGMQGECSYAANWQLFQVAQLPDQPLRYSSIPRSFPDGQINVVMFAQIYQNCNGTVRLWGATGPTDDPSSSLSTPAFNRMNRSTPAVINPELELFQVQPKSSDCSPSRTQTPYAGGTLIVLGDASARSVSANLSLTTWQRVCAPADGNPLAKYPDTNDW